MGCTQPLYSEHITRFHLSVGTPHLYAYCRRTRLQLLIEYTHIASHITGHNLRSIGATGLPGLGSAGRDCTDTSRLDSSLPTLNSGQHPRIGQ